MMIHCGKKNAFLETKKPNSNEGNFWALLRFRVDSRNFKPKKHLETTSSKATYISKTIQNEMIDICKESVQEIILSRLREAKCFCFLFAETIDISVTKQLSLSFRYVFKGVIRDDVTFCNAYQSIQPEDVLHKKTKLIDRALVHIVEDLCSKFNVNFKKCWYRHRQLLGNVIRSPCPL